MSRVKIRTLKNGPYEVSGPVDLVDAKGGTFPVEGDEVYLCRCGRSSNRPFCDGSHKGCGFEADERAG